MSLGDLIERVAPIDDGPQLFRLDELLEERHIFRLDLGDPADDLPAARDRSPQPSEDRHQGERADEGATLLERFQALREGDPADGMVDEIIRLGAREVLFRVVDHPVGPQRLHEFQIRGAAHPRHFGPVILGELHRGGAESPRGAIDEDFLSTPDVAASKKVQRASESPGDGYGILEAHASRFERSRTVVWDAGVLRVAVGAANARAQSKDQIPRFEPSGPRPRGDDLPGQVGPEDRLPGPPQAENQSNDPWIRLSLTHVPGGHGGRKYPDQQMVVLRSRFLHLPDLKDLGRAVFGAYDRFHR